MPPRKDDEKFSNRMETAAMARAEMLAKARAVAAKINFETKTEERKAIAEAREQRAVKRAEEKRIAAIEAEKRRKEEEERRKRAEIEAKLQAEIEAKLQAEREEQLRREEKVREYGADIAREKLQKKLKEKRRIEKEKRRISREKEQLRAAELAIRRRANAAKKRDIKRQIQLEKEIREAASRARFLRESKARKEKAQRDRNEKKLLSELAAKSIISAIGGSRFVDLSEELRAADKIFDNDYLRETLKKKGFKIDGPILSWEEFSYSRVVDYFACSNLHYLSSPGGQSALVEIMEAISASIERGEAKLRVFINDKSLSIPLKIPKHTVGLHRFYEAEKILRYALEFMGYSVAVQKRSYENNSGVFFTVNIPC
jgi:hypothetical protein